MTSVLQDFFMAGVTQGHIFNTSDCLCRLAAAAGEEGGHATLLSALCDAFHFLMDGGAWRGTV